MDIQEDVQPGRVDEDRLPQVDDDVVACPEDDRVEFGRQPRGRQNVELPGDLEDTYRRLLALRQAELDGSARTQ